MVAQPARAPPRRAAPLLDPLDVGIIRDALYIPSDAAHAARGPLGPWQTAERLGVHGTTVKARLLALRASGVVRGVSIVPHPSLLGRRLFTYRVAFPSPAAKEAGVASLAAAPCVLSVRDFMGREAWIGMVAASLREADAQAAELASRGLEVERLYEAGGPAPRLRLAPLDGRILSVLARDAHARPEDVARAAGVSTRTVRRRLARLHDARALALVPSLDLRGVAGALPTMLEVRLEAGASAGAVLAALPDRVHREAPRPDLLLVYLVAGSLGAAQEAEARALALRGVVRATTRFLLGVRVNADAIVAALA